LRNENFPDLRLRSASYEKPKFNMILEDGGRDGIENEALEIMTLAFVQTVYKDSRYVRLIRGESKWFGDEIA